LHRKKEEAMSRKGYQEYFNGVEKVLAEIRATQGEKIGQAARIISDTITADGLVHVFGTGHSNLLAEEVFYRAGTLAPINHVLDISLAGTVGVTKSEFMERLEGIGPILYSWVRPNANDCFIIISNSGRNAAPIELARESKEHGHSVIAISSVRYSKSQPSRHSSGKLLLDYADVVLDNCGPIGDACIIIPTTGAKVGPTSTVAGAYIINAIIVQAAFNLEEAGFEPPVFISGNLDGAREHNQKLLDRYWHRIKNW
jgi:uncharacterized phosphosugar-binding protein